MTYKIALACCLPHHNNPDITSSSTVEITKNIVVPEYSRKNKLISIPIPESNAGKARSSRILIKPIEKSMAPHSANNEWDTALTVTWYQSAAIIVQSHTHTTGIGMSNPMPTTFKT